MRLRVRIIKLLAWSWVDPNGLAERMRYPIQQGRLSERGLKRRSSCWREHSHSRRERPQICCNRPPAKKRFLQSRSRFPTYHQHRCTAYSCAWHTRKSSRPTITL
ncbi:hypothetical protein S83_032878 [Arachis hypogaea]